MVWPSHLGPASLGNLLVFAHRGSPNVKCDAVGINPGPGQSPRKPVALMPFLQPLLVLVSAADTLSPAAFLSKRSVPQGTPSQETQGTVPSDCSPGQAS